MLWSLPWEEGSRPWRVTGGKWKGLQPWCEDFWGVAVTGWWWDESPLPAWTLLVPLGLLCSQDWGCQLFPGTGLAHAACQGYEMQEKNIPAMYPVQWFSSTLFVSGFYCCYHFPWVFCLWILENFGVCRTNRKWTLFIEADFRMGLAQNSKGAGLWWCKDKFLAAFEFWSLETNPLF